MNLKENKKVDTNTVELVVEVKGDEFKKAVDNAFKKNLSKMSRKVILEFDLTFQSM